MPLAAVIDNDVLIKGACYDFLIVVADAFGREGPVGVLGAARYVVADQLDRRPGIRDRLHARNCWLDFLANASELEPTEDELDLATSIEEEATARGLPLDGGESQLCAITILRAIPRLISGDKRAMEAGEVMLPIIAELVTLAKRCVSLEQLVSSIVERIGAGVAKTQVCAEPEVDKTMAICFECTQDLRPDFYPEGLASYIANLRTVSPTLLMEQDPFPG